MKKNSNITLIIVLILGSILSSCNEWLNLNPENAQTSDQYWETKEEVEAVVAAGYVKMQNSVDELFVWGEIRGDGIQIFNSGVDDNIKAADKIREMDILPTNHYAKWDKMYQVINMANSVIRYAPSVLDLDPSFTESQMNSFISEAKFQRALAYFYLVRTFRDVPLILQPYVNDDERFQYGKTEGPVILDAMVQDLRDALPYAKSFFPEVDYENQANSKGRATKWAIHALLADIYLWQGEYANCIAHCDSVINSGRVGLIGTDLWYTNYFPGNSNESVYEIQFDYSKDQTNNFLDWFYTRSKYIISIPQQMKFMLSEELGDIRGLGASYTENSEIWKYMGIEIDELTIAGSYRNTSTQDDQNFIIYRLADLILMKAEAYVMLGDYEQALTLIKRIRDRADIEDNLSAAPSELEMLHLILEERSMELFAEGKRWFDLLRVARRDNFKYKDYLIQHVLQVIPLSSQAIASSKLSDVNSYYLPIHEDELNSNPLLVQNPYYQKWSY